MIKAGFIQFQPAFGDLDKTISRLNILFEDAKNADLLVLPELANSGYNFDSFEQAYELSETIEKSTYLNFIAEFANRNSIYILTGFNEREKDKLFNSAVLIGPESIIGKYRKVHLFMNEKDIFQAGDLGFPVFDIGHCRIGIQICFDYLFPESWRILALKGAQLICHPSNFITPYPQKVIPAHAVINRYYVITCNRTGTEKDLTFTGESFIINPHGDFLFKASSMDDELFIRELDVSLSDNKMITKRNHVLKDRFPEQYKDLTC